MYDFYFFLMTWLCHYEIFHPISYNISCPETYSLIFIALLYFLFIYFYQNTFFQLLHSICLCISIQSMSLIDSIFMTLPTNVIILPFNWKFLLSCCLTSISIFIYFYTFCSVFIFLQVNQILFFHILFHFSVAFLSLIFYALWVLVLEITIWILTMSQSIYNLYSNILGKW